MRQVVRALSQKARVKPEDWMLSHGLSRYTEPSVKGSADIDWSDASARRAFLGEIVADARRLLAEASGQGEEVLKASRLLSAILLQDVQEGQTEEGGPSVSIREGTAAGRIPSVSDPEQRHGHKSKSKLFTGHKSAVAVEEESAIITGVDVLAGDASDANGSLELVQQTEENTGLAVAETVGDCAYGGGANRQSFVDDGRTLHAKVPQASDPAGLFPKQAFALDLDNHTVTCPEGHVCSTYRLGRDGGKTFLFGPVCAGCEMRSFCTTSASGRSVHVHPQEGLLQEARAFQETPEGRSVLRGRVVVEHRLARLGQLGIGQARYVGRRKSLYQLTIAAAIANLRRTWNWTAAKTASDSLALASAGAGDALAVALARVWRALAGRFWGAGRRPSACMAA